MKQLKNKHVRLLTAAIILSVYWPTILSGHEVQVGVFPTSVTVSEDGSTAFVLNGGPKKGKNRRSTLSVVHVADNHKVITIDFPKNLRPQRLALEKTWVRSDAEIKAKLVEYLFITIANNEFNGKAPLILKYPTNTLKDWDSNQPLVLNSENIFLDQSRLRQHFSDIEGIEFKAHSTTKIQTLRMRLYVVAIADNEKKIVDKGGRMFSIKIDGSIEPLPGLTEDSRAIAPFGKQFSSLFSTGQSRMAVIASNGKCGDIRVFVPGTEHEIKTITYPGVAETFAYLDSRPCVFLCDQKYGKGIPVLSLDRDLEQQNLLWLPFGSNRKGRCVDLLWLRENDVTWLVVALNKGHVLMYQEEALSHTKIKGNELPVKPIQFKNNKRRFNTIVDIALWQPDDESPRLYILHHKTHGAGKISWFDVNTNNLLAGR